MTRRTVEYHTARARAERVAAATATCRYAAASHAQLAELHDEKAAHGRRLIAAKDFVLQTSFG